MLRKTSRTDAVKDKAADLLSTASDTVEDVAGTVKEKVAPVIDDLADKLDDAKGSAADTAAPHAKKLGKRARKANKKLQKASAKAQKSAAPHLARVQEAGLTREQAHSLFAEEWMPRIQHAIQSASASGQHAYAALPAQARGTIETVAPVVKKKKKKGGLLIALGLLAGAGAAALIVSGKKADANSAGPGAPEQLVEVERVDITEVSDADSSADLVGAVETRVDKTIAGGDLPAGKDKPRGRHAARD